MEVTDQINRRASKEAIEEFKTSILWADIVDELNFWIEGFKNEQDGIVEDASTGNPSTASVLLHLGDINGRKKAVIYMLNILDMFLDEKGDKEDGCNKAD